MPSPAQMLSYWLQVAAVAALVGLALAMVAGRAPLLRLVSWRAFLALALLLPLSAFLPVPSTPVALSVVTDAVSVVASTPAIASTEARPAVSWPALLALVLAGGAAVRVARLLVAWHGLVRASCQLPGAESPLFDELRAPLGVEARLVWHDGVSQPFTFGHRPAIVVMPADLASAPQASLRGIFAHELTHVARRDWRWLLGEETVGALLWFHPAVRVALREVRQAREELVDRATVAMTGARRTYLETLVSLAGRPASSQTLSLSIFGARQLPRRIAALASEASMSRLSVVAASTLVVLTGAVAVTAAVHAFPLTAFEQAASTEPGPLEKQAYVAPRDAQAPSRLHYVAPVLPASAADMSGLSVDLRLVLDASGRVAEARILKGTASVIETPRHLEVFTAILTAARQWRFAVPAAAPLAITSSLSFESTTTGGETRYSTKERPVPVTLISAAYPEADQKAGTEGLAEVEVTIESTGRVSAARVVKATTPAMGEAAVAALRESTFRPGQKDGQPVPVQVTVAIRFALK